MASPGPSGKICFWVCTRYLSSIWSVLKMSNTAPDSAILHFFLILVPTPWTLCTHTDALSLPHLPLLFILLALSYHPRAQLLSLFLGLMMAETCYCCISPCMPNCSIFLGKLNIYKLFIFCCILKSFYPSDLLSSLGTNKVEDSFSSSVSIFYWWQMLIIMFIFCSAFSHKWTLSSMAICHIFCKIKSQHN